MTSPCELQIYCNDTHKAKKIAQKILNTAKELEIKYNFYNPSSYLSALNQRQSNILDTQTKDLLTRAKLFYTQSNKIFDITMGTLSHARKQKTQVQIEEAMHTLQPYVGVEHFKIKKNKLIFDNPHTLIDLGGFVKEYAVDMAVKILKKAKIQSGLINFGGDIYALGIKPNGHAFSIGIKNPLNPTEYITQQSISNQALTTSASYERRHTIEGKTYSHIITKEASLQEKILSVTVIAKDTVEAGVFSTALMINPQLPTRHKNIQITQSLKILKT